MVNFFICKMQFKVFSFVRLSYKKFGKKYPYNPHVIFRLYQNLQAIIF